jgi:hypothetical protein
MAWDLYVARGWATIEGTRVRVITGLRDPDRKILRVTPVRDRNITSNTVPFGIIEIPESEFEPMSQEAEPPC